MISDQDKLFQVYLFELQSVTIADIKAIGRAFRDKAGNFLFVITDDYEEIEFVLLDRIGKAIAPAAISTASPSMVPAAVSALIGAIRRLFIAEFFADLPGPRRTLSGNSTSFAMPTT